MPAPNLLADLYPANFTIYGFCTDCNHSTVLPRLDENMTIPALEASIRCSERG